MPTTNEENVLSSGGSFANNVSFNVFAPLIEFNADSLFFFAGEKQTFELQEGGSITVLEIIPEISGRPIPIPQSVSR